jgi:anti-anti-sigma factor
MKLQTSNVGGVTVIAIVGDINADSVGRLNTAVLSAFSAEARDFVIDLGKATSIDSAGLEALTALHRQCEEQLGMVRLAAANVTVRKILEITRLDRQFTLHDDVEDAVGSFAAA